MKTEIMVVGTLVLLAGTANAAERVAGTWRTEAGEIAVIDRCDANYCITAKSGQYAGQKLGSFAGSGDSYTGRITDPRNKVTYSGKLTVSGDSLKLRGCATPVLCKTQTWSRSN